VSLELKVKTEWLRRGRSLAPGRLEAEYRDRESAGSGGQAADLKPPVLIGYGRDPVAAALGGDRRAGDRLAPGTYDAALYLGGGRDGKNQTQPR
jgi:hypothetical protein